MATTLTLSFVAIFIVTPFLRDVTCDGDDYDSDMGYNSDPRYTDQNQIGNRQRNGRRGNKPIDLYTYYRCNQQNWNQICSQKCQDNIPGYTSQCHAVDRMNRKPFPVSFCLCVRYPVNGITEEELYGLYGNSMRGLSGNFMQEMSGNGRSRNAKRRFPQNQHNYQHGLPN